MAMKSKWADLLGVHFANTPQASEATKSPEQISQEMESLGKAIVDEYKKKPPPRPVSMQPGFETEYMTSPSAASTMATPGRMAGRATSRANEEQETRPGIIERVTSFVTGLPLAYRDKLMASRHFSNIPVRDILTNLIHATNYKRGETEYGGGAYSYELKVNGILRDFDLMEAGEFSAHIIKTLKSHGINPPDSLPDRAVGVVCSGMNGAQRGVFLTAMKASLSSEDASTPFVAKDRVTWEKPTALADFDVAGSTAQPAVVSVVNDLVDELPDGLIDDLLEGSRGAW